MSKEFLVREIEQLREKTRGSFPYDEIGRMRTSERLISHFQALGDDDELVADLNTYFLCVEGIASRLLQGREKGTPEQALQWLSLGDFFTIFPKYHFLASEWKAFPQFARLYEGITRMREIELALLLPPEGVFKGTKQNPSQGWHHFLGPVISLTSDDDTNDLLEEEP